MIMKHKEESRAESGLQVVGMAPRINARRTWCIGTSQPKKKRDDEEQTEKGRSKMQGVARTTTTTLRSDKWKAIAQSDVAEVIRREAIRREILEHS